MAQATWEMNDPSGPCVAMVNYNDTTGRVESIAADNQNTQRACRFKVYDAQGTIVPPFPIDLPANRNSSRNMTPQQNFIFDQYGFECGFV